MAESQTTKDFIAGWIGGVAGIIVSNPLDVLKIRLQTSSSSSLDPRRTLIPVAFSHSPSFIHHGHTAFANLALQYSIPPNTLSCVTSASPKDWPIQNKVSSVTSTFSNLKVLWRQEGYRFLFAGAAAPILGLAFIDSFFFATYGKCMSIFNQDRERPSNLNHVFASGATAGGVCALLQTPIEVIKCRAQAEHFNQLTGAKAGSFVIAKKIYQRDGLRGFYLGGLMTGLRDSLSSGIFFTSYALIRRNLQDFYCFASHDSYSTSSKSAPEIFQLMFAGGMSGVISALLPYPLDIIKTRLQVTKVISSCPASVTQSPKPTALSSLESSPTNSRNSPKLSPSLFVSETIHQIYTEGKNAVLPHIQRTRPHRFFGTVVPILYAFKKPQAPHFHLIRQRQRIIHLSLQMGGLMGFFKGLKPTLLSSFVGSGITMGIFEFVFDFLGNL